MMPHYGVQSLWLKTYWSEKVIKPEKDAYGQELLAFLQGEEVYEIIEREDHFIDASPHGPAVYFSEFPDWPQIEQEAIQYAHGRVLDVGCGAGRVCLYLQEKGLEILGIDNSPLALEVCKQRGVNNVSLTPLSQVSSRLGIFDTIVMFGNNFGLFESHAKAKHRLRKFARLTSPEGCILAESSDIYLTTDQDHLAYQASNRQKGRMSGQIRLRVRHRKSIGSWFDYLMVSKGEMEEIVAGTGWEVGRFIDSAESPLYIAILEKVP
jgi:2-polyprenyl-3-methyl-5-hydroxy-6-metoxy-1,4-benzoquinol methylase